MQPSSGLTYRDAGVDIDAGDELVERIKPIVKRTLRPEVLAGVGGFGALVSLIAEINTWNRLNVITRQPAGDYEPGRWG